MKHAILFYLVPLALLLPPAAYSGEMAASAVEKAVEAGFSDLERQIIERYYGKRRAVTADEEEQDDDDNRKDADKHAKKDDKGKKGKDKDLPPGLAKRGELPPGLAKADTLPPGLAKRNLPDDLEKQLPPAPEGYERRIVDDVDQAVIVLVDKATGKVADLVKDVLVPRSDEQETIRKDRR